MIGTLVFRGTIGVKIERFKRKEKSDRKVFLDNDEDPGNGGQSPTIFNSD